MTRHLIIFFKKVARTIQLNLPHIKLKRNKYVKHIRSCYDYSMPVPTIICSTCVGGMMLHDLGLQFKSPTVNLWMLPSDLVKFVSNIPEYINSDLKFTEMPPNSPYNYPVATLGDITLYFSHYASDDAAGNKWNERKKRIDFDNLYIITDDNRLPAEDIEKLKKVPCKRLVIFTTKEHDDDNFFTFYTCHEELPLYSVRDMKGFAPYEREFNYAKWLSGAPLKDCRMSLK